MKNFFRNHSSLKVQRTEASFECSHQIRERKPGEKIDYYECTNDYTLCPNKFCIKNLV